MLSGWTLEQEGCGIHGLGHLQPLGAPKSYYQGGGLPRAWMRAPPKGLGLPDFHPSGGIVALAQAEGGGPRALRKRKEKAPRPPPPPRCCSRQPLVGLPGVCLAPSSWASLPVHAGEELLGAHWGCPATCNHPPLIATGVGEGREAQSQLWSPLLDALLPHKAGGGLQSSPQQAPGSQDHQGFFLSDNQSGEQNRPLPESAPPAPEGPAQPPGPWQVLPCLS